MLRFTWNHYSIILKIKTVRNIKRKMPKNHDKQNLVTIVQTMAKGKINITWTMTTCMNFAIGKSGAKVLMLSRSLNEMVKA